MKLKVCKFTREETETELDLPVFFHFQGELLDERYVKWDGKEALIIDVTPLGISVEKTISYNVEEHHLKYISTEEEFNEQLIYLLQIITKN